MPARTLVTFTSDAFNVTEQRPEFINPDNFGDDLARWLAAELRNRGIDAAEEVGQEDFGWYFSFRAAGVPYCFLLGHRDSEGDSPGTEWLGWVEREAGLLGSLFGARGRGIQPEGLQAIHGALSGSPLIREIRWHERAAFEAGDESGSLQP